MEFVNLFLLFIKLTLNVKKRCTACIAKMLQVLHYLSRQSIAHMINTLDEHLNIHMYMNFFEKFLIFYAVTTKTPNLTVITPKNCKIKKNYM